MQSGTSNFTSGPLISFILEVSTTNRSMDDDDARPYVIVADIGKGSFATVYKGYHEVRPCNALGYVTFD